MAMKYNSLVQDAQKQAQGTNFPLEAIPKPLDIARLYDLDANPHMWMVDAVPTDRVELPPYLADSNVQQGIASVLAQDRIKEEILRLREEYTSMIKWMEARIDELKHTIAQCTGKCLSKLALIASVISHSIAFKDAHFNFFLDHALKETLAIGANWKTRTDPWANMMKSSSWPKEILGIHHSETEPYEITDTTKISGDDDEVFEDIEELDEDTQIEILISEVSILLEEDEVDALLEFE